MKKYERVKALVSLDAIAHNFEEMHKNVKEGTKIIAVIKADGYGHGARAIARLIQDYDYIWGFATATAEEALELRHAGITKPVLILGLVFEEYYEELAANDVRITISDLNTAVEYAKAGARIGKNVHIHLALDTGMTRIGYADIPENAVKIEEISKIPNLVIEGMFTHFARADETDRSPALVQLDRYLRFVTERFTRMATIPVGYADGYPRQLSNKGWVLIHGKKAPILGRVCMDQFMVDVTDIPEVKAGDEVTLMGRDGDEFISVETLGDLSGRFSYEFVCEISKRVPRIYIKDGKECGEEESFFQ